jgi:hypothetical protein
VLPLLSGIVVTKKVPNIRLGLDEIFMLKRKDQPAELPGAGASFPLSTRLTTGGFLLVL